MCGIAGFHVKNPKAKRTEEGINTFVDQLLLGIESRGKHATGLVAVTDDKQVILDKAAVEATEFIKDRDRIPVNVQSVLLHTRYATKGEPSENGNNHPVVYKSCFTIHNGSISNDDDLFREFNLKRNHEVDTEVIPALLDKHGLGDMAHIKEALTKFRGPLAIATIDPVNHPGRVLLAKGIASPLIVFENDNLVVWASLQTAIKDAWGNVFGTPPQQSKFSWVQEGSIILLDGKNVTKDTYEVARYPSFTGSQRSGNRPAWERNQNRAKDWQRNIQQRTTTGTASGANGGVSLWGTATSPFSNEAAFQKEVAWYREQGKGNARTWRDRETLGNDLDTSDVPAGEAISWVPCKCGEAVLAQDMRRHFKYGHVCVDCYVVIRDAYTKKAAEQENTHENVLSIETAKGKQLLALNKGSEDEKKYREIPQKDKDNMEMWADCETKAHALIINAVSQESGYSRNLVDFLVFRTGAMVQDFGKGVTDLKTELTAAYHTWTPLIWEEYGEILLGTATDTEGSPESWDNSYDVSGGLDKGYTAFTVKKPAGVSEIWYYCPEHSENFRQGDDCPTCSKVDEAIDNILSEAAKDKQQCDECGLEFPFYQLHRLEKENYLLCGECNAYFQDPCEVQDKQEQEADEKGKLGGLARCVTCKTFISKNYPCKVCTAREAKEPEAVPIEKLVNIESEVKNRCKGNGEGRACRAKVRYCIGNVGAYCKKHFEVCSEVRCTKKANHVLPTGKRVCHGHSRSVQGVQADRMLQKAGVVFQEVR